MSTHLITSLRAQRQALTAEKDAIVAAVEARGAQQLTETETSRVKQIRSDVAALDERIDELEAAEKRDSDAAKLRRDLKPYDGVARVGAEARTYNPGTAREGVSFFADAHRRQAGDYQAGERIARHMQEATVERELRATSTGSFAGLIVPQYLVEEAALLARAGRPLANAVRRLGLPEQGSTFQVPRGTTGASAAVQASENTNVSSTDEVWANLQLNVVTIAGQQDVSRQSLERGTPGIDQLVYSDLSRAYAVALDQQLINGSGTSGQALGILQTAGIDSASAFGAAVTMTNFYSKVAGRQANMLSNRFAAPNLVVMHPRRWAWALAQVDGQNRPLVVPAAQGAFNATGTVAQAAAYGQVAGTIQGIPVILDANLPTNVGTNSEDVVLVLFADDILLYEDGDGMPRELRFEQTLGNQLTVKLVVYGYTAMTAGRYPASVGKIGGADAVAGNGLIAPTLG